MIVERFTLIELLLTRQWLIMVASSRDSCGMNKDQAVQVGVRIKEIDAELTRRVIDGDSSIAFNDLYFADTIKQIREEVKEKKDEMSGDPDDGT